MLYFLYTLKHGDRNNNKRGYYCRSNQFAHAYIFRCLLNSCIVHKPL